MNPGLVVKLRPAGPWRIGPDSGARNRVDVIYHSDSLYSAVTSAMSRMGSLADWLDATARSQAPAVCFSSCFPFLEDIGFVVPPRTIWPPTSPAAMSARVRWKSARFIPLSVVESILAGKRLNENHWSVDGPSGCLVPAGKPGPFRTSVRWNAAVDRLSGATERHATACIEFREGCGLWTVVGFHDGQARDQWLEPVKAAFRLLADTGFGGERSRGWGRSETPEFVEGTLPGLIIEYQRQETPPPVEEPPTEEPPVTEPPPTEEPEPEPEPPEVEQAANPELPEPVEPVASAEPLVGQALSPANPEPADPVEPVEPVAPVEPSEPIGAATVRERLSAEATSDEPHVGQALSPANSEPASEAEPVTEPAAEAEPPAPALEVPAPESESAAAEPEAAPPEAEPALSDAPIAAAHRAPDLTEPMRLPTEESITLAPPAAHLTAHWLLSLFTPAAEDAVDWGRGSYTVLARGGRIDSPAGSGELKKQIQMVAEGSVLYADGVPLGTAADVAPDGFAHPVFRAGFALAIPLPEVH
jgi:CRISPR type III-A-associated RAMP protein Csm4